MCVRGGVATLNYVVSHCVVFLCLLFLFLFHHFAMNRCVGRSVDRSVGILLLYLYTVLFSFFCCHFRFLLCSSFSFLRCSFNNLLFQQFAFSVKPRNRNVRY